MLRLLLRELLLPHMLPEVPVLPSLIEPEVPVLPEVEPLMLPLPLVEPAVLPLVVVPLCMVPEVVPLCIEPEVPVPEVLEGVVWAKAALIQRVQAAVRRNLAVFMI